jgi:hypothetical protein
LFDYNNNNLVDFDDIVKLYDMLWGARKNELIDRTFNPSSLFGFFIIASTASVEQTFK